MLVPESGWWGSHTSREAILPEYLVSWRPHHRNISLKSFRLTAALQGTLKLAEPAQARGFRLWSSQACRNRAQAVLVHVDYFKGKNQKTTCRIWPGISISLWKNLKIPELIFSMKGVYCPRSRFSNVGVFHEWNFDSFLLSPSHWEDPSSQVTGDNVAIISMTFCHWYLMLLGWGGGEEKELFCRQFWFSSFLPNIPHNLSKINFTEIQAYVSLETYWTACE